MTVKEIMKELDIKQPNARMTISRLKEKRQIVKIGDKWGLMSQEEVL